MLFVIACGPSDQTRREKAKYKSGQIVVLKGLQDTLIITDINKSMCNCGPQEYDTRHMSSGHISDTLNTTEEALIDHSIEE